mgnify:CR=1 FL=1
MQMGELQWSLSLLIRSASEMHNEMLQCTGSFSCRLKAQQHVSHPYRDYRSGALNVKT